MHTCILTCIYIYMHTFTQANMRIHTFTNTYIHTYTNMHTHMHAYYLYTHIIANLQIGRQL